MLSIFHCEMAEEAERRCRRRQRIEDWIFGWTAGLVTMAVLIEALRKMV